MIKNKKAESLVWIIIAVFILSFTILGILNIFWFNQWIESNYKNNIYNNIIKWNSENLIKKLDIPEMNNNDFFYIKKDKINKKFSILTWSINQEYQYIDYLGNKVNPNDNLWKTYRRVFQFKADILRHVIYPNEIPNIVFWYDANNINWNNNLGINYWDSISTLKDLSWNWIDATESDSWKRPILKKDIIKDKPGLKFDWNNDLLKLPENRLLNNDWDNYANKVFEAKTYSIVFKTWDDVNSDQVIYEEWGAAVWYNFMIHNWNLYAWVHNKIENCTSYWPPFMLWFLWGSTCHNRYQGATYSSSDDNWYFEWDDPDWDWYKDQSIDLWEILPDTIYFITIIQDSTHFNHPNAGDWVKTWLIQPTTQIIRDPIDSQNRLKIYLNWELVKEINHVDPIPEHYLAWIWNINKWSVKPRSPYDTISEDANIPFKWYLWEFISWNHALTNTEIRWIQNYFEQKWYDRVENVRYNIIKTNSFKVVE